MKNTSGGVVTRLAKQERLVFSFNNIDFKRASNMNTGQPVGALKNKQSLSIDVPPEVVNGRTFVPLRFIAEAFGAKVSWDGVTHTVKIFGGQH